MQTQPFIDDLLELRAVQGAGLREDEDVLPEGHEGGDGTDAEAGGQFLLVLRVDLAEHDVGVLLGGLLEHGGEHAARPAPAGPEIEEHDVVVVDSGVEVVDGYLLSSHARNIPPGVCVQCAARTTPPGP